MDILGIDIGGSGIKGALVNTESGKILGERVRIATPLPAKPEPVAQATADLVRRFDWHGPIGCGFPAAIHQGVALTASNIHKKWIGTNAAELFSRATNCPVYVLNDADAAGQAEMTFGAGRDRKGVVIIVTIGTDWGQRFLQMDTYCLMPSWVTSKSAAATLNCAPRMRLASVQNSRGRSGLCALMNI